MDSSIKNVNSYNCINRDVIQPLNRPYQPIFVQEDNVNKISEQKIINKEAKKLVKKIMSYASNKVFISAISQNELQPIKPNAEPKSNESPLKKRVVRFKKT